MKLWESHGEISMSIYYENEFICDIFWDGTEQELEAETIEEALEEIKDRHDNRLSITQNQENILNAVISEIKKSNKNIDEEELDFYDLKIESDFEDLTITEEE